MGISLATSVGGIANLIVEPEIHVPPPTSTLARESGNSFTVSFGKYITSKIFSYKHYVMRALLNFPSRLISIDTPRQIAETRILSLRCVDALRGGYLRAVVARFAESIYTVSSYCVDLTLESLTPSGLSDEPPTDWVKSD